MRDLNQNTATVVVMGPAVDPVSALSVSTMSLADADAAILVKHNTSVEQNIASFTFSHASLASGLGFLTLRASVLDTLGQIMVIVEDESLHLPVIEHFHVIGSGIFAQRYGVGGGTPWASLASVIASQVWEQKEAVTIAAGGIPVGGFATGAITAAAIAADAIGSSELASTAVEAIADAFLNRNLAGGGNADSRGVRNAFRMLRNRVDASTGIVYQENDSTTAWTFAVSTVAGDPIVAIDPA